DRRVGIGGGSLERVHDRLLDLRRVRTGAGDVDLAETEGRPGHPLGFPAMVDVDGEVHASSASSSTRGGAGTSSSVPSAALATARRYSRAISSNCSQYWSKVIGSHETASGGRFSSRVIRRSGRAARRLARASLRSIVASRGCRQSFSSRRL